MTITMSWNEVISRARIIARRWDDKNIYGIPNGGLVPAALIVGMSKNCTLTEDPRHADVFVDDVIDSGATRNRYVSATQPFVALVDKSKEGITDWVSFPWERMTPEGGIQDNIRRIIQHIEKDPNRAGLKDTPERVAKSYKHLFSGYHQDPEACLTVFDGEPCDEMVLLKDVEFMSTCEHHMLPFIGKAHIAYIPQDNRVVGISKLVRVLEIFSRRLQIQERICHQVVAALMEHLGPIGAACILEAKHHCMICRGVEKQNSVMVTSSLAGAFKDDYKCRQELLTLIKG